jgi:hypothetical protein
MESSEKRHVFDNPRNIKLVVRGLFACSAALILLDLVIHRHLSFKDGVFETEAWFGYYSVYGFVACVLLVLAAKQMRKILMRAEDYYDR